MCADNNNYNYNNYPSPTNYNYNQQQQQQYYNYYYGDPSSAAAEQVINYNYNYLQQQPYGGGGGGGCGGKNNKLYSQPHQHQQYNSSNSSSSSSSSNNYYKQQYNTEVEGGGGGGGGGGGAKSAKLEIWGPSPKQAEKTMNLENVLLLNIQAAPYFKELMRFKTYHEVIDEIVKEVDSLEPWISNSRVPSTAFCLLYKLFTLRLTIKQLEGMLKNKASPFVRGIGFLYLRYVSQPKELWDWFEPYLSDAEELKFQGATNIGKFAKGLLKDLHYCETLFPRIPVPVQRDIDKKLKEYETLHPEIEPEAPKIIETTRSDRLSKKEYRRSSRSRSRSRGRRSRSKSRSRSRERRRHYRSRSRSRDRRHRRSRSRSRDRKRRSRSRSRDSDTRRKRRTSRSRSRSPIESLKQDTSDSVSKVTVSAPKRPSMESLKALYGATTSASFADVPRSNQDLSCASETLVLGGRRK